MISRRWLAYSSMIRRASSERDSLGGFVGWFHVTTVGAEPKGTLS